MDRSVDVKTSLFFLGLVLCVCAVPAPADIVSCEFEIFTDNGLYDDATGFSMDVSNGDSIVGFTFYNDSSVQSSITAVYFDDGALLGATYDIINGSGTAFAEDGPNNIPGGNNYPGGFDADREFNIAATSPAPENGVNNTGEGEEVTIRFELLGGGTLQDIISELASGELKVGIHIQDFPDGSSESAVNVPVPEPATIALLALGGLWFRKRKA